MELALDWNQTGNCMNQPYIHQLKERVLTLHADLLKYEWNVERDAEREGTGKVYPENKDMHMLLEQALYSLELRCQKTNERVGKFLR
jgi:hypothetical protein